MGQFGDWESLQPHTSWAGERSEEQTVAAKNHVLNATNSRDLKRHAGLKCTDMSRMHPQVLAGCEIAHNELAGKLQPRDALPTETLEQEAAAAEDARAERLLEADRNLDLRRRAQEPVAMDHVLVPGRDFNRNDVSGQLGGERNLARRADGAIFGHEQRSAASHALQHAEEASAAGELRVRGHLDGAAHPRKFSRLGDDGLVRFQ